MHADDLDTARYLSLATYRASGAEVATPVWCAREGDDYFIFSAGDAGKIKRLRRSSRARVAACTVRGRVTGEWHEASAVIVSDRERVERALRALRRKYGLTMWIADLSARATGRFRRRAYIEVTLTPARD